MGFAEKMGHKLGLGQQMGFKFQKTGAFMTNFVNEEVGAISMSAEEVKGEIVDYLDNFLPVPLLPAGLCSNFQLILELVLYGNVMLTAADFIGDGSELLLLIPAIAPLVGSVRGDFSEIRNSIWLIVNIKLVDF